MTVKLYAYSPEQFYATVGQHDEDRQTLSYDQITSKMTFLFSHWQVYVNNARIYESSSGTNPIIKVILTCGVAGD